MEAPTPLGARSDALIPAANIQADVTSCIHVIILTSGSNPIAISRVYFHRPPPPPKGPRFIRQRAINEREEPDQTHVTSV